MNQRRIENYSSVAVHCIEGHEITFPQKLHFIQMRAIKERKRIFYFSHIIQIIVIYNNVQ